MSVNEILEQVLAKLVAADEEADRKSGIIQFNLIDQRWTLDLGNLTLEEGEAETPDTTVDVDNETFLELVAKTLTNEEAIESGRMVVSGDAALLNVLCDDCD